MSPSRRNGKMCSPAKPEKEEKTASNSCCPGPKRVAKAFVKRLQSHKKPLEISSQTMEVVGIENLPPDHNMKGKILEF